MIIEKTSEAKHRGKVFCPLQSKGHVVKLYGTEKGYMHHRNLFLTSHCFKKQKS
jgi:hypothetical protein